VSGVSEAAAASGLPPKTVRYYDEIGLVRPGRSANGYRAYGPAELRKLVFVARARDLGFSIDDCRALLGLYEDRGRASADVKRLAGEHLQAIDRKIEELRAMRATLAELVDRCCGDDRPDCPILRGLAGESAL
jgi:MerR family transcriptional regulator, copper efflux regulator